MEQASCFGEASSPKVWRSPYISVNLSLTIKLDKISYVIL
jgi:hypothetical protein